MCLEIYRKIPLKTKWSCCLSGSNRTGRTDPSQGQSDRQVADDGENSGRGKDAGAS